LHGEIAAADAGLVGGDYNGVAGLFEQRHGIHAAGQGNPFVFGFHKIVAVLVEHAVAVEDDEFHGFR
jgi:hypothetical protein